MSASTAAPLPPPSATTTDPEATTTTEVVVGLDLTQGDEPTQYTFLEIHKKGYDVTGRTRFVEHIDFTRDEDVAHVTKQEVRPKRAATAYPTIEAAVEEMMKKRLMKELRAARNKKRYQEYVTDLTGTDDEEGPTAAP